MTSSPASETLRKVDPTTIQDKFLVGYQGWFTCGGDGHHGWLHWFDKPIPDGGRPNMDLWPDVSAYSPSELFPAPGLTLSDRQPACLFSSRHPCTVQRHFHWMAEHHVDGCFLQRFASHIEADGNQQSAKADLMRLRDEIGDRVREAAEKEGRVFAIMYDISGVPAERLQKILEVDWNHLIRQRTILDSPNYLREQGRPVVAIWGVGFAKNHHDPAVMRHIVRNLRGMTPGGAYVMAGTPTHWQTLKGDADTNPAWLDIYYHEFDAISPWTIGRYRDQAGADSYAIHKIHDDIRAIQQNCQGRKVDYIPVVWPGGSEYHLSNKERAPNFAPREGGKFLWRQIFNAKSQGVRILYGAMWDEYDEGTALMPVVSYKSNLPREANFLALDADAYDLPSDWYMRICGLAADGLHGERPISDAFPKKELDDYWSSRPRLASKSSEAFRSGLNFIDVSGPNVASSSGVTSYSTSESNPPVLPDPLAAELAGSEEAPPPYSLESEEASINDIDQPQRSPLHLTANSSQQSTSAGSSVSVQSSINLHSWPLMNASNYGSQPQVSEPVVPSSLRPTPTSPYGSLHDGEQSQTQESRTVFIGGFTQGYPPHAQSPKPFGAASSHLVEEFHNYKPVDRHSLHQRPAASHSPVPTHSRPPLNPSNTESLNTNTHFQYSHTELQQQGLLYQASQENPPPGSHYGAAPLPIPRHPSVTSTRGPSHFGVYPHRVHSHQGHSQFSSHEPPHQTGHHYPSHHQPQPQQLYSPPAQRSQSTHPKTQNPAPPVPPRSPHLPWGVVNRVRGTELRRRLEQDIGTAVKRNTETVTQTMDSVVQSVDNVVQTGKKLLNIYKVPSRK